MKIPQLRLAIVLILWANSSYGLIFTAGVDDSFGGGTEPATPSAEVAVSQGGSLIDFDVSSVDEPLIHTFVGLPSNIVSGSLTFRIRGVSVGSDTDGLAISFISDAGAIYADEVVYARTFGAFGGGGTVFPDPDPGFVTPGASWNIGSEAFVTLDLAALPLIGGGTLNLLPQIGAAKFMDVLLGDDSMVDFIELNLLSVPLPGAIVLFVSGVLTLLRIRRTCRLVA